MKICNVSHVLAWDIERSLPYLKSNPSIIWIKGFPCSFRENRFRPKNKADEIKKKLGFRLQEKKNPLES